MMDTAPQQRIAGLGRQAAYQEGVAYQWNWAEAFTAAKKGGHSLGNLKQNNSKIDHSLT